MDNSSLFWSIVGVMGVLVISTLAIGGLENAPVRDTFKTGGSAVPLAAQNQTAASQNNQPASSGPTGDQIVAQVLSDGGSTGADTNSKAPTLPAKGVENNIDFSTGGVTPLPADNKPITWNADSLRSSETENSVLTEPDLGNDLTPEVLRQAGFEHFIIKTKPFSGKILGLTELSEVNTDQIREFVIDLAENGTLTIDQIKSGSEDLNKEFFDFLKGKLGSLIGATINQTNQFGLASFYLNFTIPQDNVFLVVKYKTLVYALSYPRPTTAESGLQPEVENLLKVLK